MKQRFGASFDVEVTLKKGDGTVEKRRERKQSEFQGLIKNLIHDLKKLDDLLNKSQEN